jgi:hypothetical protein
MVWTRNKKRRKHYRAGDKGTVLNGLHRFLVENIHVNKTLTQNIEYAHKYVSSFRR